MAGQLGDNDKAAGPLVPSVTYFTKATEAWEWAWGFDWVMRGESSRRPWGSPAPTPRSPSLSEWVGISTPIAEVGSHPQAESQVKVPQDCVPLHASLRDAAHCSGGLEVLTRPLPSQRAWGRPRLAGQEPAGPKSIRHAPWPL